MMEREHWTQEFTRRYVLREDELKWLYCELYHNDMQAYRYFVDMLYRAYEARPESLKNMDRAREEYPDWLKTKSVLMSLILLPAIS